eukprot:GILJ01004466.1.p1 GENE.GILJ01004466.1~~GILJ01004466.1.p1  ORF type:complete len:676 (+),score=97.68 GILJ01004466.1:275-2029(+)
MKQLGCTQIIAFCSVGSLRSNLVIGSIMIPDDYYDIFGPITFFPDSYDAHIVPGFNEPLRQQICSLLGGAGLDIVNGGVYALTTGPRFETKAEIRALARAGDIVGMTGAHEATLAKELSIPYALICFVDNMANGIEADSLTLERFLAGVHDNKATVEKVVELVVHHFVPQEAEPKRSVSTVKRQAVDMVIQARWVLATPSDPSSVMEDTALVIDKGKVIDIATYNMCNSLYEACETVCLNDHVVLPGLINTHTTVSNVMLRGRRPKSRSPSIASALITHSSHESLVDNDVAFVKDSTRLAVAEMIRGGTTCIATFDAMPDAVAQTLAEIGIRAFVGLSEQTRHVAGELYAQYKSNPLLKLAFQSDQLTVSDVSSVKQDIPQEKLPFYLNAESMDSAIDSEILATTNVIVKGAASKFVNLADSGAFIALSPRTDAASDEGLQTLRNAGGFSSAVLSTTCQTNQYSYDLFQQMTFLSSLQQTELNHRILGMATTNGAKALGLEKQIGLIQPNMYADLIAIKLEGPEFFPLYNPSVIISSVVDRSLVTDVWVNGKRLLKDRVLTTVNLTETLQRAKLYTSERPRASF